MVCCEIILMPGVVDIAFMRCITGLKFWWSYTLIKSSILGPKIELKHSDLIGLLSWTIERALWVLGQRSCGGQQMSISFRSSEQVKDLEDKIT